MGDHLSAKAELQNRAGALADSTGLRGYEEDRLGLSDRHENFILAVRFSLQLLWLGKQRFTAMQPHRTV